MESSGHAARSRPRIILWIARSLSAVLVLFVLLFAIGSSLESKGDSPSRTDWVGLMLFPLAVCVGLLLGWRWYVLGALLSLVSLLTFCIWLVVVKGDQAIPLPILVFAVPAILYLVHGLHSRRAS